MYVIFKSGFKVALKNVQTLAKGKKGTKQQTDSPVGF